jgi:hypothetical protein
LRIITLGGAAYPLYLGIVVIMRPTSIVAADQGFVPRSVVRSEVLP